MTVSGPQKIIYLTLGILFLTLGVVGLIIPVIPGVLFLMGAIFMLTRGSRRVREYAEASPRLRNLQDKMARMDAVSMVEKAQVAGLMTVEATVSGARKLHHGVRRLLV